MSTPEERHDELATQIAEVAASRTLTVGVAESLTGGRLSTTLAAAPDASDWFRGALVAYAPEVKFDVLGVTRGPVNTADCAAEMARGALRLLECDAAVAATGVGGPGPDEGVPAGTVFIACARRGAKVAVGEHHLDGDPEVVVAKAVELGLQSVLQALIDSSDREQAG